MNVSIAKQEDRIWSEIIAFCGIVENNSEITQIKKAALSCLYRYFNRNKLFFKHHFVRNA